MSRSPTTDIAAALAFFLPNQAVAALEPLGRGNINDTWKVTLATGRQVVLQRLYPHVFPDMGAVMANMRLVTTHLGRAAERAPGLFFFQLIAAPDGQDHRIDAAGCCWRLLTLLDRTRTLASLTTPAQAETVGGLLGAFHLLTADLNPDLLADPLPDFHVTPRYLAHYDAVCRHAAWSGNRREDLCREMIERLRPIATLLEEAGDRLGRRVIHGDPKAANFLFAADGDRAVSLIDFDTVKPGLVLHDLGDCLRSCCNPQGEHRTDPEATVFDPDLFQFLMAGYLRRAADLLTPADRGLLVAAAGLIGFELGLRFFTDHLEGNRYFKVSRPGENLHRALVQLHLALSIHNQQGQLERRLAAL
ncbi:aminoglycoside phosphotransferase family protein [Desulfobulbus sp.]|uniref:phosphotransferase enzyme family protein n=1 Tax=Desulfobulbus sp. TaxID=895 RepID=UPI00286EECDD|nr:aminoglycoside phosphotransferase family protein [Desulfobulbus sp.]